MLLLTPLATSNPQSATSQKSDAQKSFDLLETLAGSWKGQGPEGPVRASLCVTSGGSALPQEMVPEGMADFAFVDFAGGASRNMTKLSHFKGSLHDRFQGFLDWSKVGKCFRINSALLVGA